MYYIYMYIYTLYVYIYAYIYIYIYIYILCEWNKNILRFSVAHKKINLPNNFWWNLICYCSFSFPNVGSVL